MYDVWITCLFPNNKTTIFIPYPTEFYSCIPTWETGLGGVLLLLQGFQHLHLKFLYIEANVLNKGLLR